MNRHPLCSHQRAGGCGEQGARSGQSTVDAEGAGGAGCGGTPRHRTRGAAPGLQRGSTGRTEDEVGGRRGAGTVIPGGMSARGIPGGIRALPGSPALGTACPSLPGAGHRGPGQRGAPRQRRAGGKGVRGQRLPPRTHRPCACPCPATTPSGAAPGQGPRSPHRIPPWRLNTVGGQRRGPDGPSSGPAAQGSRTPRCP